MTMPLSRRDFLQAAGTGAGASASAAVWIPWNVHGYTGPEMTRRAEQAGGEPTPLGVSLWDLDTPALVVDLDALEANLATMQRTVAQATASRAGRTPRPTSARRLPACSSRPARSASAWPR